MGLGWGFVVWEGRGIKGFVVFVFVLVMFCILCGVGD